MAGRTSGAERDARRILAEAGVAAIDDLRGQVAALEARLAEVEREKDEARAACSEACTEAGSLTATLEQERTLSSHLHERATAAEARVRELKDRLARIEATTREAADLLGIVASYVGSEGDAGLGQIKWARDARRVETALRAAMGETNG